jgi:hypothetical protein
MTTKLSAAQMALLKTIPDEFERFQRRRGFPHMLGNPTVHALIDKRLIDIDTVPPRWRRTEAGRAALGDPQPGGAVAGTERGGIE